MKNINLKEKLVIVTFKNSNPSDYIFKFKFKTEENKDQQILLIREYLIKNQGFNIHEDIFSIAKILVVKL